jgi:hypothetical protein
MVRRSYFLIFAFATKELTVRENLQQSIPAPFFEVTRMNKTLLPNLQW